MVRTGDVARSHRGRYDPVPVTDLRPRPLPESPAHPPSAARRPGVGRRSGALLACAVLALLGALVLGAGPATAGPARPTQDGTTETSVATPLEGDTTPGEDPAVPTTVAVTTAEGLDPVAGDGATTTTTESEEGSAGSRRIADENRKIWVVVAGLIAVAVCLTLLTIRYWHQTRPSRLVVAAAPPTVGRRARKEPPEPGPGRRSRRAVAGADHAGADETWEPRGTGEHDRVVVPTAERRPRPDRAQRAAAYAARRSR